MMESEVEDGAQRHQLRRQRVKTSKAIELDNLKKQRGNRVGDDDESSTGSELEVTMPGAPRPIRSDNRLRTPLRKEMAAPKGRKAACDKKDTLASILRSLEDMKAEIKEGAMELMKELAEVKTQLAETKAQLADVISNTSNLSGIGSTESGSGRSTGGSSPQSDASVLARAANQPSAANQPYTRTTNTNTRPIDTAPPGVTIDTRQMKDKSKLILENIPNVEEHLKTVIQAVDILKEVQITGLQVRGHNVRVLTPTSREAALLRTNDGWVNRVFEGARTRGEDWHPVKIDDVVKAAVIKEDGHTIKEGFSEAFCSENGVSGVLKAVWLSKGNKLAGSIAVFFASADEARHVIEHRLVKVGGQIAFAGEFHRIPRPIRCYNCNRYGHYQSRCVHDTTCGNCSRDHRTDSCVATEKKCPACGDAHAVTDPGCPVYRREKTNLIQTSRDSEPQAHISLPHV